MLQNNETESLYQGVIDVWRRIVGAWAGGAEDELNAA